MNIGHTLLAFQCNSGWELDNIIKSTLHTNFGSLQSFRIILWLSEIAKKGKTLVSN